MINKFQHLRPQGLHGLHFTTGQPIGRHVLLSTDSDHHEERLLSMALHIEKPCAMPAPHAHMQPYKEAMGAWSVGLAQQRAQAFRHTRAVALQPATLAMVLSGIGETVGRPTFVDEYGAGEVFKRRFQMVT